MTTASRRTDSPSTIGRAVLQTAAFVVLVNAVGAAPSVVFGTGGEWLRGLDKPGFYPPQLAFPIAWTALFTLLGIALWLVWRADADGRTLALWLFAVQFLFNVAWTPAFFGLESVTAGLAVIIPLWFLVVATTVAFARVDRRAGALLVPYLAWVTFALALSISLWRLNG